MKSAGWRKLIERGLSSPGCSPGSAWLLLVAFLLLPFVTYQSSVSSPLSLVPCGRRDVAASVWASVSRMQRSPFRVRKWAV